MSCQPSRRGKLFFALVAPDGPLDPRAALAMGKQEKLGRELFCARSALVRLISLVVIDPVFDHAAAAAETHLADLK